MGKFKVGDKARLNSARLNSKVGEIVEVVETDLADQSHPYLVRRETETFWVRNEDLKKVNTKNQRIESLEKRVGELELIVHELRGRKVVEPSTDEVIEFEGNKYRKVDRLAREGDVVVLKKETETSNAFEIGKPYKVLKEITIKSDAEIHNFNEYKIYEDIHSRTPETVDVYEYIVEDKPFIPEPTKTPNQLRAEIIEKAKGFVEAQIVSGRFGAGNVVFGKNGHLKFNFYVNPEKRTVAFVGKNAYVGEHTQRGIAKCNPSDVFNEHIGKAIALGRALGLDVSEFEGAVQPTEIVKGMYCKHYLPGHEGKVDYYDGKYWRGESAIDGSAPKNLTIINDTNAIYKSEVE